MRLPELLTIVADGPKARSFSIYDRCKAQYARYCGVLNISREPLRYLRGPGEGYSDVILRLVEVGWWRGWLEEPPSLGTNLKQYDGADYCG
jgi:hypothetical protein